jgi:pyruvate dehydrogenase (quinone)
MPRLLDIAMRTAIDKGGVAVVVLPGDVGLREAEGHHPLGWTPVLPPTVLPPPVEIGRLAELVNGAGRITLLCGAGCAGARDEVLKLAETIKAPIVHTLRGKDYIEHDNPFDVGMTGLIGFSSGYHAMLECELLMMLGTDFPYRQFYPANAKVAQIDLRAENLGRRTRLDLGLVGDVGGTLALLLPKLANKTDDTFLSKARDHYREARRGSTSSPSAGPVASRSIRSISPR